MKAKTRKPKLQLKIKEFIEIHADPEHKDKILLADGLDEAFIGLFTKDDVQVAVYGIYSSIFTLRAKNKWSWQTAEDYFNYNTLGCYVGAYTPIFIQEIPK